MDRSHCDIESTWLDSPIEVEWDSPVLHHHVSGWPKQIPANNDKYDARVGELKGDWAVMTKNLACWTSQW